MPMMSFCSMGWLNQESRIVSLSLCSTAIATATVDDADDIDKDNDTTNLEHANFKWNERGRNTNRRKWVESYYDTET